LCPLSFSFFFSDYRAQILRNFPRAIFTAKAYTTPLDFERTFSPVSGHIPATSQPSKCHILGK
jgi:hypothetical protein